MSFSSSLFVGAAVLQALTVFIETTQGHYTQAYISAFLCCFLTTYACWVR